MNRRQPRLQKVCPKGKDGLSPPDVKQGTGSRAEQPVAGLDQRLLARQIISQRIDEGRPRSQGLDETADDHPQMGGQVATQEGDGSGIGAA